MVFIDQEGGQVARLKEAGGFKPLPSAKEFNLLSESEKRRTLRASFAEMRALGIHFDFAPVIDVDYNADNPNIGKIKRSYSADIGEVEANALLASEIARETGIGLCLKHFPGIGGARWIRIRSSWTFRTACAPSRRSCSIRLRQKCSAMPCSSVTPSWRNGTPTIR